jgi:hypothetical protein
MEKNIKYRTKRKRTEFDVQKALCKYVGYKYPNAEYFSDLAGTHKKATKEYQLRKGRGWPDWMLFEVMDTRFNALMLELKKEGQEKYMFNLDGSLKKNIHLQEQLEKIYKLRDRGYCAGFAIGSAAACCAVDAYLSGDMAKLNRYIWPAISPIF